MVRHAFIPRVLAALAIVSSVLFSAIGLFAAQTRPDELDGYLFAYYAKRMLAGQSLYVDLWDNKPPGIYWADAIGMWLSDGGWWGIAFVCCAAGALTIVAFATMVHRWYGGRTAVVAAMLASLYLFSFQFHVGANRPATFFVLFEVAAALCYVSALRSANRSTWLMMMSGACVVAAMACRQTSFAVGVAIAAHVIWRATRGDQGWRRRMFWLMTGVAAAILFIVVVLWITSSPADAWRAVVSANVGFFTDAASSSWLPSFHRWPDIRDALTLPLILAAAAIVYTIFVRRELGPHTHAPSPMLFAITWLIAAMYLATISPHDRMHYFAIALPPLLLLANHAVWVLFESDEPSPQPRMHVIIAFVWFAFMIGDPVTNLVRQANRGYYHAFVSTDPPRNSDIINLIRTHTKPTDAIFIWNYHPDIYWHADRPIAIPHNVLIHIEQLGPHAQPKIDEVLGALRQTRPTALVLDPDQMRNDKRFEYGDFPDWIESNYQTPTGTSRRVVWILRRD